MGKNQARVAFNLLSHGSVVHEIFTHEQALLCNIQLPTSTLERQTSTSINQRGKLSLTTGFLFALHCIRLHENGADLRFAFCTQSAGPGVRGGWFTETVKAQQQTTNEPQT